MIELKVDRAAQTAHAMPHEELSADELLACCWDDPAPGGDALGTVLVAIDDERLGHGDSPCVGFALQPYSRRAADLQRVLDLCFDNDGKGAVKI